MLRELDSRTSDGVVVTLQYDETEKQVFLELLDNDGLILVPIPASEAVAAFNHPYCFVPR